MVVCKPGRADGDVGPILGYVLSQDVPCRNDVAAVQRSIGTVERIRKQLEAPALARHAADGAEQKQIRDANAKAIATAVANPHARPRTAHEADVEDLATLALRQLTEK
jgi:hypothetical protein